MASKRELPPDDLRCMETCTTDTVHRCYSRAAVCLMDRTGWYCRAHDPLTAKAKMEALRKAREAASTHNQWANETHHLDGMLIDQLHHCSPSEESGFVAGWRRRRQWILERYKGAK